MQDAVLNSIIFALKQRRLDQIRRMDVFDQSDAELIVDAFAVLQALDDAGWQVMPLKPTADMIAAVQSGGHWGSVPEIYRNFVDAAPKIGQVVNAD